MVKEVQITRCRNCGKRIKTTGQRRLRIYCDGACRQAAHRKRVKFNEDPSAAEQAAAVRLKQWEKRGYQDAIIERLMSIWRNYGDDALEEIEKLLTVHRLWVVEDFTAQHFKRDKT